MRLVAAAEASASRSQALADRAAAILFYVALAAGIVTLLFWWVQGDHEGALVRTATVLVIACPHALGLAIPLVIAISTSLVRLLEEEPSLMWINSHVRQKDVDEGFAKGSVLFDGADGRNYMVHASRRETRGMVEVHTKDTDILYVLKGTATVVTGGTMVEGKNIAPDEIRGREITGGETRNLVPGDAMIIPNGVPHWFKEVQAPFLYYVVKVR